MGAVAKGSQGWTSGALHHKLRVDGHHGQRPAGCRLQPCNGKAAIRSYPQHPSSLAAASRHDCVIVSIQHAIQGIPECRH